MKLNDAQKNKIRELVQLSTDLYDEHRQLVAQLEELQQKVLQAQQDFHAASTLVERTLDYTSSTADSSTPTPPPSFSATKAWAEIALSAARSFKLP